MTVKIDRSNNKNVRGDQKKKTKTRTAVCHGIRDTRATTTAEENKTRSEKEIISRSLFSSMELKVWVEGIQRIVCGVTETTTCQVYY